MLTSQSVPQASNTPRVEWPTAPQLVPLLALVLGVLLTAAAFLSSRVHLAYELPGVHTMIDTTIGLVSFLLAYLVFGRLQVLSRKRDYMLAYAFAFSGCVNLYAAMTQGISDELAGRAEVWTVLLGHLVVALLIAAAALTTDTRTEPPDTARFSVYVMLGLITFVVLAALIAPHLPWSVAVPMSPIAASKPYFWGPRLLLLVQAVVAVAYALAAWGFSRRRDQHDDLLTWLASSCLLFALASVDYLAFPSIYSDWIYVGDVLRLGGVLLLFVGALREITSYRMETAAIEERRRVARDLHDGVAQELAYIATMAKLMEAAPSEQSARRVADAAQHALDESRLVIATLAGAGNPSEQIALTARDAAHRFHIEPVLDIPEQLDLKPSLTEALLRIVREAVSNAGRHAHASVVTVKLDTNDGVALEVHDDGEGFDVTQTPAGFGLTGMRERAEAIGGIFTVSAGPQGGSTVRVVFP
jgi:signal transduction histidine kinase